MTQTDTVFLLVILWKFLFFFSAFLSVGGIRFELKECGNNGILNCNALNRSITKRFVSIQL